VQQQARCESKQGARISKVQEQQGVGTRCESSKAQEQQGNEIKKQKQKHKNSKNDNTK
jgi:hypothetical protein